MAAEEVVIYLTSSTVCQPKCYHSNSINDRLPQLENPEHSFVWYEKNLSVHLPTDICFEGWSRDNTSTFFTVFILWAFYVAHILEMDILQLYYCKLRNLWINVRRTLLGTSPGTYVAINFHIPNLSSTLLHPSLLIHAHTTTNNHTPCSLPKRAELYAAHHIKERRKELHI